LSPWPEGHGLKATRGTLQPVAFREDRPINRPASMGTWSASMEPSGPASKGRPTAAMQGPTSPASAPGRVPVGTHSACSRRGCACRQKVRRGSTSGAAGTVLVGKDHIAVSHMARTPTGSDSRRPSASRPGHWSPASVNRPRRPQTTSLGVVASLNLQQKSNIVVELRKFLGILEPRGMHRRGTSGK
jgi:hypothetical protein